MPNKIILDFDGATVKAELNDSETSKEFYEALPLCISVGTSGMDYCGQMPIALAFDESEVGRGWKNGDVNYNPHGGWFAVFFGGEDVSEAYDDQLNMGRLADGAVEILVSETIYHGFLQGWYGVEDCGVFEGAGSSAVSNAALEELRDFGRNL